MDSLDSLSQGLTGSGRYGATGGSNSRPDSANSSQSSSCQLTTRSGSGVLSQAGASSFHQKGRNRRDRRHSASSTGEGNSQKQSRDEKRLEQYHGDQYEKHQARLNKQRNVAAHKLFEDSSTTRSMSSSGIRGQSTKLKVGTNGGLKVRKPGENRMDNNSEQDKETTERNPTGQTRPSSPIQTPAKRELKQKNQEYNESGRNNLTPIPQNTWDVAHNDQPKSPVESEEDEQQKTKRELVERGLEEIRQLDKQLSEINERAKEASETSAKYEYDFEEVEEQANTATYKHRKTLYAKLGLSNRLTQRMVHQDGRHQEGYQRDVEKENENFPTVPLQGTSGAAEEHDSSKHCSKSGNRESSPIARNPILKKNYDSQGSKRITHWSLPTASDQMGSENKEYMYDESKSAERNDDNSDIDDENFDSKDPDTTSPSIGNTKRGGNESHNFIERNKALVQNQGPSYHRLTAAEEEKLRVWLEEETDTSTEGDSSEDEAEEQEGSRTSNQGDEAIPADDGNTASENRSTNRQSSSNSSKRKKGNAYKIRHKLKERMSQVDEQLSTLSTDEHDNASNNTSSLHAAQLRLFPFFMTMVEEEPFDTLNYWSSKDNINTALSAIREDNEDGDSEDEYKHYQRDLSQQRKDPDNIARDHVFSTDKSPQTKSRPPSAAFSVNTYHASASQYPTPRKSPRSTREKSSEMGHDPVIAEERKKRFEKRRQRRMEMIDTALYSLANRKSELILQELPGQQQELDSPPRPSSARTAGSAAVDEYLNAKSKYESWRSSRRSSSQRNSVDFDELKSIATVQRPITRKDIEVESARCKSTISEDHVAPREQIEKLVEELRGEYQVQEESVSNENEVLSDSDASPNQMESASRSSRWTLKTGNIVSEAMKEYNYRSGELHSGQDNMHSEQNGAWNLEQNSPDENVSSDEETMPQDSEQITAYAKNLISRYLNSSEGKASMDDDDGKNSDTRPDEEMDDVEDEIFEEELKSLRHELKQMKIGRMELRDAVAEANALYAPERLQARQDRWDEEHEAQMCSVSDKKDIEAVELVSSHSGQDNTEQLSDNGNIESPPKAVDEVERE